MPSTNGTNGKVKGARGVPTGKDEIIDLAEQLHSRYDKRNKELVELLRLYDEVGIYQDVEDEEVYRVVVPDGASAIDLVCDMISSQDINLVIPAAVDKATERKAAAEVRTWMMAWWRLMEREEDLDLRRELAQDACKFGAACLRVIVDDDRVPTGKEGEMAWADETFPMVPEMRDIQGVYPLFRRQKLTAVVDSYDVSVLDAKLDYPDLSWPSEWKSDEEITVNEYWSDTHMAFWVKGRKYSHAGGLQSKEGKKGCLWLQEPVKHNYGRLPYVYRFLRGESKYRNDPVRQARGFLKTWHGTLKVMNAVESAKVTTGLSYTNNAWIVTTRRQRAQFRLDIRSNKINYLQPDESVEALRRGELPVDLAGISGEWREKFQRQSVPDAVYGEGLANNMAGYAIALQGDSGRRILQPATKAVQDCLADMFSIALAIVDDYLGPLYKERGVDMVVHTYETKPESEVPFKKDVSLDHTTIAGLRYTEVEIGNPMPQDDERAVRLAQQLRQPDASGNPLASDETILEKVLKYDSRQERLRIERQKFRALLYEQAVNEVMSSLGIGPAAEEEAMQTQEMMQMVDQRMSALEEQMAQMSQDHENMPIGPDGEPMIVPEPRQLDGGMPYDLAGAEQGLPTDAGGLGLGGNGGGLVPGGPIGGGPLDAVPGPGPDGGALPPELAELLGGGIGGPPVEQPPAIPFGGGLPGEPEEPVE